MVDLLAVGDVLALHNPIVVTDRRAHLDQPTFLPEGRSVLFVARDEDRSDIYRYDLSSDRVRQLTRTWEDDESFPQPVPSQRAFSVVRRDQRGRAQLLSLDFAGRNPSPITEAVREPIAAYAWVDEADVVVVTAGPSPELLHVDLGSDEVEPIGSHVGTAVQRVPGRRTVSFVRQETPSESWIMEYDLDSRETRRIAPTFRGHEDHVWTPGGVLLTVDRSDLRWWRPGQSKRWQSIADIGSWGVNRVLRVTVNPQGDKLALVVERAGGKARTMAAGGPP